MVEAIVTAVCNILRHYVHLEGTSCCKEESKPRIVPLSSTIVLACLTFIRTSTQISGHANDDEVQMFAHFLQHGMAQMVPVPTLTHMCAIDILFLRLSVVGTPFEGATSSCLPHEYAGWTFEVRSEHCSCIQLWRVWCPTHLGTHFHICITSSSHPGFRNSGLSR